MAQNRTNSVAQVSNLQIDDRIQIRSLQTGKTGTFVVEDFSLEVVERSPRVIAHLRDPHENDTSEIVLFTATDGIRLTPADNPTGKGIAAAVEYDTERRDGEQWFEGRR